MRLEVPRTYLHLHEQAIKPRKGGSKDRKVDIIIYPHLPGGEEGIEELANSLPHPPCLRVAARGLQLLPSAAGRLLFSLSRPPGFRRAREEWIAGARAGRSRRGPVQWVGWSGLVWRELERETRRGRDRQSGVALP